MPKSGPEGPTGKFLVFLLGVGFGVSLGLGISLCRHNSAAQEERGAVTAPSAGVADAPAGEASKPNQAPPPANVAARAADSRPNFPADRAWNPGRFEAAPASPRQEPAAPALAPPPPQAMKVVVCPLCKGTGKSHCGSGHPPEYYYKNHANVVPGADGWFGWGYGNCQRCNGARVILVGN
ncbi:MAG: hypothetical protein BWX69_00689 [Planctomycetes bacterium ADurb.Bin069]|jgi:hypothetical protein|nr:MAG: hypothetical protein BWX69_00689 [Planctomycetes bacterium ADurb.Bin069]HOE29729.1 hypothetical protein [Planctomycetota bacterium]